MQNRMLITHYIDWTLSCSLLKLVYSSKKSSFCSQINNTFVQWTAHCFNKIRNVSRNNRCIDLNWVRNWEINDIFCAFENVLEKFKFCKVIWLLNQTHCDDSCEFANFILIPSLWKFRYDLNEVRNFSDQTCRISKLKYELYDLYMLIELVGKSVQWPKKRIDKILGLWNLS